MSEAARKAVAKMESDEWLSEGWTDACIPSVEVIIDQAADEKYKPLVDLLEAMFGFPVQPTGGELKRMEMLREVLRKVKEG